MRGNSFWAAVTACPEEMKRLLSTLLFFCTILCVTAGRYKRLPPRPPQSATTSAGDLETTSTDDDLETTLFPSSSGSDAETTEPSSGPRAVLEGQCSLGTVFPSASSASLFSMLGKLYVNFEEQAPCSGVIIRWELCFTVDAEGTNSTIHFVTLRHDQVRGGYEIVSIYRLDFTSGLETGDVECEYRDTEEGTIDMREGDFLGFVSFDHIQVALVEGMNATSTLMSYDVSPQTRSSNFNSGALKVGNLIDQSEFISSNNRQLIPMVRVILDEASSTEDKKDITDGDILGSTIYIATVGTASFVIAVLLVIILFMCCYICCQKGFRKKAQVTHTIRVEPLFERSMQYNDMYVPSDQNQIISQGKKQTTNIQQNPAYSTSQLQALRDSDQQSETTSFSIAAADKSSSQNCLVEDSDLDHTYELIKSIKSS